MEDFSVIKAAFKWRLESAWLVSCDWDCNITIAFWIDFAPTEIPIGAKSIGKEMKSI